MRITIDVPDRLARDAVTEYRTPRQQAEYLIRRALERDGRDDEEAPRHGRVFDGQLVVRPTRGEGVEVVLVDAGLETQIEDWARETLGIPVYSSQGSARVRLTLDVFSDVETG